ncbi:MAG: hypothetical protein K2Q13_10115 [Nitrosomonas sp.]|uniref:hypothetical protein n=1 Tax=Nitrosomonas sp. TaxID=42353 RepID=UPI0025D54B7F|nr:hypothetical protein [Nitrosomonas sp.]MBY0475396.1 hypothetical protein [Nitrosomonas sp.]
MRNSYFSNFPDAKRDTTKEGEVDIISVSIPQLHIKPPEIPEIREPPNITEIPEIEFISFTFEEIKSKTDDELSAILSGESYADKHLSSSSQTLIACELSDRSIKRLNMPHWLKDCDFWFKVITIILAASGLWITYQSLAFQKNQSVSPMLQSDDYWKFQKSQEKSQKDLESLQPHQKSQHKTSTSLSHEENRPDSLKTHAQEISERQKE